MTTTSTTQAAEGPQEPQEVATQPERKHGDVSEMASDTPERVGTGRTGPGFFGRMFDLEPFDFSDAALVALAATMRDNDLPDKDNDNPLIPAGYTYLGQFIDHDTTFDAQAERIRVLEASGDQPLAPSPQTPRTPVLDLDSVYGLGPVDSAELYDPAVDPGEARLKIGRTSSNASALVDGVCMPTDLPRDPQKPVIEGSRNLVALLGDPRNDENLIVAQLHLAFLKFHNKVVAQLLAKQIAPATDGAGLSVFEQARQLVRWHYQWIVLHDFVRRLVMPAVLDDVLLNGRRFYLFEATDPPFPYMPFEFSGAAYRMGHSMIRDNYDYNRVFKHPAPEDTHPPIVPASLELLFQFTGSVFPNDPEDRAPIPSNWTIDWRRFFELDPQVEPNLSRKIDAKLAPKLSDLPEFTAEVNPVEPQSPVLAQRNLARGRLLKLPTGQAVAKKMGVPVLAASDLATGTVPDPVSAHGFDTKTPLWYYILKEAAVKGGGIRLGPVGSRIVSEVFVGMLQGDADSYLFHDAKWQPTLPAAIPGTFTMPDLLRYVGEINPIGDDQAHSAAFTCA